MIIKEIKVPLLMGTSLFMEMLDSTIVTTALPQIKQELQIPASNTSLIITVYMIMVAIFIPLSGWLSRKYGNKNIWLFSIFIFVTSSLGSGLSANLIIILVMRSLQGFSAALIVPTARLIVLENTPPKDLLKMISYVIWPALIAPAIAPFIGGLLTTYLSWRWIFMINIPIGILLLLAGHNLLEKDQSKDKIPVHFDWLGFLSVASTSS
ncbi:MFS transporter [Lactiplantibacillus plantarum]|nr:MFS transporter [Lactiplantibacillus plantarum]